MSRPILTVTPKPVSSGGSPPSAAPYDPVVKALMANMIDEGNPWSGLFGLAPRKETENDAADPASNA